MELLKSSIKFINIKFLFSIWGDKVSISLVIKGIVILIYVSHKHDVVILKFQIWVERCA